MPSCRQGQAHDLQILRLHCLPATSTAVILTAPDQHGNAWDATYTCIFSGMCQTASAQALQRPAVRCSRGKGSGSFMVYVASPHGQLLGDVPDINGPGSPHPVCYSVVDALQSKVNCMPITGCQRRMRSHKRMICHPYCHDMLRPITRFRCSALLNEAHYRPAQTKGLHD